VEKNRNDFDELLKAIASEENDFKSNLVPDIEEKIMENITHKNRAYSFYYLAIAASIVFFIIFTFTNPVIKNSDINKGNSVASLEGIDIISTNGSFAVYDSSGKQINGNSFAIPVTIKTAGFSVLKLKIKGKAIVMLRPDSTIKIKSNSILLKRGKALFDFNKLKMPFIVETSHAKISILGTKFSVEYDQEKTRILLLRGKISVSNLYDSIILDSNEGIDVQLDSKKLDKYTIDKKFIEKLSKWEDPFYNNLHEINNKNKQIIPDKIKIPDINEEFDKLKGKKIGEF